MLRPKDIRRLTEKEKGTNNEVQLFRLAKVAQENEQLFYEISDAMPFFMNINRIDNLNSTYANEQLANLLEVDKQKIVEVGYPLIRSISHLPTHERVIDSIRLYERRADMDTICSYFQYLVLHKKWQWVLTYKMFLSDNLYLNMGHLLDNFGAIGGVIQDILGENLITNDGWQKFQSLTKREKEILKMISRGDSSGHISEQLFISPNTVRTHRQKVMQKIDAKSLRDVIRFTQAFELTGQL